MEAPRQSPSGGERGALAPLSVESRPSRAAQGLCRRFPRTVLAGAPGDRPDLAVVVAEPPHGDGTELRLGDPALDEIGIQRVELVHLRHWAIPSCIDRFRLGCAGAWAVSVVLR